MALFNIQNELENMLSIVLSNPNGNQQYKKIRVFASKDDEKKFFCEFFTKTQSFHKTLPKEDIAALLGENRYKNTIITTDFDTITILSNKKGNTTVLKKPLKENQKGPKSSQNKQKSYILQEGIPVPFLIHLGVMTEQGKVISSKYDKFRQINRFLEFIDDIISKEASSDQVYRVLDFGCGKSYLTFALYYFLVELRKKKAQIIGIDLKEDVIKNCSNLAELWGYNGLSFQVGRIEDFATKDSKSNIDLVITLHACDTATDYALKHAITHNAKAILSVPCCQHEINAQLTKALPNRGFEALMKYGIIKERFSALATDVMRAELLESQGYKVQLMEFIDLEHTAKNVLIRAVKKSESKTKTVSDEYTNLCKGLGLENTLARLINS